MRSVRILAAAFTASMLLGCDITYPWTEGDGAEVPPAFTVLPAALTFNQVPGGAAPAPKRLDVTLVAGSVYLGVTRSGSVGSATLVIDSPTTAHVDVTVAYVSPSGTYSGQVTITGCLDEACVAEAPGSPVVVPVTYEVAPPGGAVSVAASPSSLTFTQVAGGADPTPKSITLSRVGGGTAPWAGCVATAYSPISAWLTMSFGSVADLPSTVWVTAHVGSLPAGTTRTANLYFGSPTCNAGSVTVPVTFTVTAP